MAIITIQYDARNAISRKIIDFVLSLENFQELKQTKKKQCGLDKAIDEIKHGKTTTCKNFDDFLSKINS